MSDFLTNLAARTLQAVPIARPRLAARFESLRVDEHFSHDDSFGGELEVPIESIIPPHTRDREDSRPQNTAVPPRAVDSAVSAESQDRPDVRRHNTAATYADSLASREQFIEIDTSKASRIPAVNDIRPIVSGARSGAEQPINVHTIIERIARADRGPRSEARHPTITSGPDSLSASVAEAPTVVAPLPRVTPKPVSSWPSTQRELEPEPAPIIRVTIGRVEVRAISTPAPAPRREKPARADSSPSLNEYLKQRSEERR